MAPPSRVSRRRWWRRPPMRRSSTDRRSMERSMRSTWTTCRCRRHSPPRAASPPRTGRELPASQLTSTLTVRRDQPAAKGTTVTSTPARERPERHARKTTTDQVPTDRLRRHRIAIRATRRMGPVDGEHLHDTIGSGGEPPIDSATELVVATSQPLHQRASGRRPSTTHDDGSTPSVASRSRPLSGRPSRDGGDRFRHVVRPAPIPVGRAT